MNAASAAEVATKEQATARSTCPLEPDAAPSTLLTCVSFVVAAHLQVVRGYDAFQTGVIFTAETVGPLAASLTPERLAKRRAQRTLTLAGFLITMGGIIILLLYVIGSLQRLGIRPGLLLIGLSLGLMLTAAVNVVQSSFAKDLQGEISGLSRSVSNLGSCLGAAVAGIILVASIASTPQRSYGLAMIVSAAVGAAGLPASAILPAVVDTAARSGEQPEQA